MQPPRTTELLAIAVVAAGGALVIEHVPYAYVRLACALPLLFALPGYAITRALFGARPLPRSHLVLLSVGLSLSVSTLAALVLSLATNGLRTGSWLVVIVGVVGAACYYAFRRYKPQSGAVHRSATVQRSSPARDALAGVRARDALLLGVALAVVIGTVVFSRTPLPAKKVQGYTALSMLPTATPAHPTVLVGVESEEQSSQTYRLEIRVGAKVAYVDPLIALDPGQKWKATIGLATTRPTRLTPVIARLFRSDSPGAAYRTVSVWLRPAPARG